MEKSITGLYRSLLFQIFSQRPDLLNQLPSCSKRRPSQDWTNDDLVQTLKEVCKFAGKENENQFKLCIFIDGLDEYDNEKKHADIVTIVDTIAEFRNVKICVSSRPWSVFEKAYGEDASVQKLRLHKLTLGDMELYAADQLSKGREGKRFRDLQAADPILRKTIITAITVKAEGVWLWLYLVIKNLIDDIRKDEIDVYGIERKLEDYPSDIEEYLRSILGRAEPKYQEEAAKIFLTVTAAEGALPGLGVKLLLDSFHQRIQNLTFKAREKEPAFSASSEQINYKVALNLKYPSCVADISRLFGIK